MAADATGIREYKGAAKATTIVAGITNASSSFSITDSTGWPTGAVGNFIATLEQGLSTEERILCSGLAGGVITVVTRGYDNTTAIGHGAGSPITHTISAVDIAEANYIANFRSVTGKTTPADADTIPLNDVAGGNILKNFTMANLKAWIATYIASLVQTLTNKDLSSETNTLPSKFFGQNRILNGDFGIWQRGTSVASANASPYTADRWTLLTGASGSATASRQTGSNGVPYRARVQRVAANADTANIDFEYAMETNDSLSLAGKSVVVSFEAAKGANFSPVGLTCQIVYGTGTDQKLPVSFTGAALVGSSLVATLSASMQVFTITGTVPSNATQLGIILRMQPVGTAGAADYFEVQKVKFEVGSVATAYSNATPTPETELAACQRFYWRWSAKNNATSALLNTMNNAATSTYGVLRLPVTMRTRPTFSASPTVTDFHVYTPGGFVNLSVIPTIDQTNEDTCSIGFTVASGLTSGQAALILANSANAYVDFSSEL